MLRAGLCPGLTEEMVQLLRSHRIKTGDLTRRRPTLSPGGGREDPCRVLKLFHSGHLLGVENLLHGEEKPVWEAQAFLTAHQCHVLRFQWWTWPQQTWRR